MDTTTKPGSLALPMYADKPQRTVNRRGVVAVTMYASGDRSVRHYALFTREGNHLGSVSNHGRRIGQSAGYHVGTGSYSASRMAAFSNLAEIADHLLDVYLAKEA